MFRGLFKPAFWHSAADPGEPREVSHSGKINGGSLVLTIGVKPLAGHTENHVCVIGRNSL